MNGHGPAPELSVIIPAVNEAAALPGLLDDLAAQQGIALEVLVADGGSADATRAVAEGRGVRWIDAPRGRGAQMNAAAAAAAGEIFLFLHADSRIDDPLLLSAALAALSAAEAQQHGPAAGHFRLRFDRIADSHRLCFRFLEEKTALNRPDTVNGDQGMLLGRAFFQQLGGFDASLPILEDQRLAAKVRLHGTWVTLPGCLRTSARRFESEGFFARYLLMGMMMGMYTLGEWSFFHRAPGVYRLQADTGRLLLWPIFALVWSMIRREWGLGGTLARSCRLGGYLRRNGWQPFFFLDVWMRPLLGPDRSPLLAAYDRCLSRWLDFRLIDALAGLLCLGWYMGVLALYFRLREGWGGIRWRRDARRDE